MCTNERKRCFLAFSNILEFFGYYFFGGVKKNSLRDGPWPNAASYWYSGLTMTVTAPRFWTMIRLSGQVRFLIKRWYTIQKVQLQLAMHLLWYGPESWAWLRGSMIQAWALLFRDETWLHYWETDLPDLSHLIRNNKRYFVYIYVQEFDWPFW